jgi:hypothetical protein
MLLRMRMRMLLGFRRGRDRRGCCRAIGRRHFRRGARPRLVRLRGAPPPLLEAQSVHLLLELLLQRRIRVRLQRLRLRLRRWHVRLRLRLRLRRWCRRPVSHASSGVEYRGPVAAETGKRG